MFNFREIRCIHDALQNFPQGTNRTEIIKKIFNMVSSRTFQSVAPCVRKRNPDKAEDTDATERMVVFESERELMRLLEGVAFNKISTIGHQFVLVCVPDLGLANRLAEDIFMCLGRTFEPKFEQSLSQRRRIELVNGLHVDVVTEGDFGMGTTLEWAFFYNEVSGF